MSREAAISSARVWRRTLVNPTAKVSKAEPSRVAVASTPTCRASKPSSNR